MSERVIPQPGQAIPVMLRNRQSFGSPRTVDAPSDGAGITIAPMTIHSDQNQSAVKTVKMAFVGGCFCSLIGLVTGAVPVTPNIVELLLLHQCVNHTDASEIQD